MWHRFRRYLPVRMGGTRGQLGDDEDEYREIGEDEYEEDDGREETSVDAPAGLFSDEDEMEEAAGFSSARSSFTRRKEGEESPSRKRRRRGRTASASGGQPSQNSPPRGKFLKRSETAPRSETRSGGGESSKRPSSAVSARVESRKQSGSKRRPTSATPHSEGDAPNSENLTSRLSRRSSIISDLVALMVRRSSSLGFGSGGQNRSVGGLEKDKDYHKEQPGSRPKNHHHGVRLDDYEMEEEPDEEDMGNLPREKILERIRHHKEIIGKVRLQPWPMRRKRRALKVARQYLQKQEAQVSKWGLYKVEILRRGNQAWRWMKNLSIYLIPWESKIKQIESNFGSVVSSYFIFLRWVLGMNVANSLLIMAFVVVPEWLADSQADAGRLNRTKHIKMMPSKVAVHVDELNSVLDFGGYLQYSYLFYGYYSHETILRGFLIAYNVPVAYVCVNLFLLVFCIFIILKKMTSNTRKSKLSSGKQEQYVFTWKAVNGWDYNIGEGETAASLAMANAIKLKEASTEYKKKFKQKLTFRKLFVRLLVNWVIFSMMFLSMVAIYKVGQITEKDTFIKQNAVSITVAAITLLFPPIFELILKLEQYRPRTALRIHLFRVLFFYLLNYFTLVYSLFVMLNTMEEEMKANELWQKEQQFLASQIRPFQYQFHIVHSPAVGIWENSGNNQSFYEVVSSAVSSSKDDAQQQRMIRSRNMRNFMLFANLRNAEIRRRERRQFVQKRTRLGPKRRKRPSNVPKHNKREKEEESPSRKGERDLNVLYSSKPFPGHEPPSTTPPPQSTTSPWTTVQPHFGPQMVGVFNPQIVLSANRGQQHELGTFWESRPIVGADWGTATEAPNPLNYTSSPKIASAPMPLPYRASNYDDLCWETLIGQEIAKIVTTDLVMTIAAIMVIDFLRGLWIRYCSDWWCWDIEATFPEYGEFKVAENVLHLVNSQAMVCLGTILVPMLPLINCAKLVVVMYIRAWACMVCNVPAKQIFRASRSSNFYFWLLLAFVCMSTLPVGFVIAYKKPSKNCGPFAGQKSFYSIIGQVLEENLPQSMVDVISYFMSPGIIFPVFLLLVLIIYFLVLLVNGLRAANSDLNKQLTLERTEEKRKIFELAKGRRQSGLSYAGISHKSRPSGESKKSSNGNGNGGNGSGESYETAPNENGLNKGEKFSPLYFLNGAAKSGLRKSWHGGPIIGNGNGEKVNGEPVGILLNPLFPAPLKLIKQHSDESGGLHSPSKSPLRHATFLPSLQSVDEKIDEEEADSDSSEQAEHGHAEALISKKKQTNGIEQHQLLPWIESVARYPTAQQSSVNGSSGQARGSLTHPPICPIEHRTSLHLSWKDRLLICIGWTDPAKLEEKLRRQIDEAELEMGGGMGPKEEKERESPLNDQQRHSRMEMTDSCGEKSQRTNPPQIPLIPLEEAEYSVPSDEMEEEEPEKVDEKRSSSRGETILMGTETPRLASGLSQASSSERTSQRPISVIHNRLADLLVEEERPSSGSSAETGSQRSWVRQQPTMMEMSPIQQHQKAVFPHPLLSPKMAPFPMAQTTPTVIRRASSINGALEPAKRAIIERDHVSESSPLSQRQHSAFPTEELARLSPDKRHPLSPKAQIAAGLPPTGPKIGERIGTAMKGGNGRRPSKESTGSGVPSIRRMDGSGSSSLGTRPPSDDLSLLLESPSTPICYFRPISAENVLGQSFASSTGSDTRLQYANPYSSYAAAMCSPILPSEGDETIQSATTPILSPVPPIPLPLVLPFLQPLQSSSTTPPTMSIELPKKRSSFAESPDQSPLIGQPQPSSSSSTQTAPPLPKHQQQWGSPALGQKRMAAATLSSQSHGYATPTPTMQRRRPAIGTIAGVKMEPIYDQPVDQQRPSAGTIAGDEGGSTSGRGTMPPGYGSSPSTGSSPEFGRPKYKISSSSPGRPFREQQIQQQGHEHESGSSSEGSPRRRFEIRQRSGLGLGRPLRRMAGTNGNGNGKNGAKMDGNNGNERKEEEDERKMTSPGEKQSTV